MLVVRSLSLAQTVSSQIEDSGLRMVRHRRLPSRLCAQGGAYSLAVCSPKRNSSPHISTLVDLKSSCSRLKLDHNALLGASSIPSCSHPDEPKMPRLLTPVLSARRATRCTWHPSDPANARHSLHRGTT